MSCMHMKLINTDVRPTMRSPVKRYLLNLDIMTVTPDFVFGVLLGGNEESMDIKNALKSWCQLVIDLEHTIYTVTE